MAEGPAGGAFPEQQHTMLICCPYFGHCPFGVPCAAGSTALHMHGRRSMHGYCMGKANLTVRPVFVLRASIIVDCKLIKY
ncbi:hypothetical protein SORBI_3004G300400 [Sorghum bicolor]|uniref:Uncharacterized protein n=1 Tax=Sorghum bicolor TaxID=4558 RepID=A0A194YTF6_SORBI|nr:hypothetical protein SORBI_3004G300400 [Sorghum bicolor]